MDDETTDYAALAATTMRLSGNRCHQEQAAARRRFVPDEETTIVMVRTSPADPQTTRS